MSKARSPAESLKANDRRIGFTVALIALVSATLLSGCSADDQDSESATAQLNRAQKATLQSNQNAVVAAISSILDDDSPSFLVQTTPLLSMTSAEYARLYGPGVDSIDLLSNLYVGQINVTGGLSEYATSIRFRAPVSGQMSSIHAYYPDNSDSPGYSSGNGGVLQIRVYPDDGSTNHFPDLTKPPLASTTRDQAALGMSAGRFANPDNRFSDDVFPVGTALTAGALYHVVWQNISSSSSVDWSSVNTALTAQPNVRPNRWLDPIDFASLSGFRAPGSTGAFTWRDFTVTQRLNSEPDGSTSSTYGTPILQITMRDTVGNPKIFGNGPMESGTTASRNYSVSSSQVIRERFTITEPTTFSGVSFLTAASTAGTLKWALRDSSTQAVVEGAIDQPVSDYTTKMVFGIPMGQFSWRDAAFFIPVTLQPGTYDLEFTPTSGTWVWKSQNNGSIYGFVYPAAFTRSYAEYFDGSNWYSAYFWNRQTPAGTERQMNWPVVLHRMP